MLEALAASHPERALYRLYLSRIEVYRSDPPGADWDGVTTFETK
jgi:adenylate cyclase